MNWGGGTQAYHNTPLCTTHLTQQFWLSKRWKFHWLEVWWGADTLPVKTSGFITPVVWNNIILSAISENEGTGKYHLSMLMHFDGFLIYFSLPRGLRGRGPSFLYSFCPSPLIQIPVQSWPSYQLCSAEPCLSQGIKSIILGKDERLQEAQAEKEDCRSSCQARQEAEEGDEWPKDLRGWNWVGGKELRARHEKDVQQEVVYGEWAEKPVSDKLQNGLGWKGL